MWPFSGQATSKSRRKSDQVGEPSAETNVMISVQDDGQIELNEMVHVVAPAESISDETENFYEEENVNNEEEMQGEILYVVEELD